MFSRAQESPVQCTLYSRSTLEPRLYNRGTGEPRLYSMALGHRIAEAVQYGEEKN